MTDRSVTNGSGFPFAAVVGHDDAKLALLLAAVDPRIGGVLLRGDKGTAKSTLARGLAALRPGAPFVELPLGATEDRVVGTVDVGAALDGDGWTVRPGLLAEADGGVLYVDEVNLLAGHLVDVLLDAAASGVGRLERDGLSHTYPARFVLVGSMNPEEGELRPQLLDRFGLVADLAGHDDPGVRAAAVRRRLAFDGGATGFAGEWAPATARLVEELAGASAGPVELPDEVVSLASALCCELGIGTLRADLTLCRAASAAARLAGDQTVTEAHLRQVAPLALVHRRRRGPFDRSQLDPGEIDDALDRAGRPDRDTTGADGPDEPSHGPGPSDAPSGTTGAPPAAGDDPPAPEPAGATGGRPGGGGAAEPDDGADPGDLDRITAVRLEADGPVTTPAGAPAGGRPVRASTARDHGDGPGPGPVVGARAPQDPARPRGLAPAATVLAGVARRVRDPDGPVLAAADVRQPVHRPVTSRTLVVALDTSASMGADARIGAAREALLGLLLDAYQRRERVAVVAIGGDEPRVVLQPTSSVEVARARLARLAPVGPTPLAAGLTMAAELAVRARGDGDEVLVVLVTDGRATAATGGQRPFAAALAAADRVAAQGVATVLVDAGPDADQLGLAAQLAARLGARRLRLDALTATHVEQALRLASSSAS